MTIPLQTPLFEVDFSAHKTGPRRANDLGPFDPDELVRWAEAYGHPEEWCKRAQQAHNRAENLMRERDRYRLALELIAYPDSREVAILDEASAIAREALDG